MRRKKEELDIEGLNGVISTSNKILKVGFIIVVIALVSLILSLMKQLNILKILKEIFIVISPVFIGLIIAWLFDPVVKFLQKKKMPRVAACILVYLIFIGLLVLFFALLTPSLIEQVKDFIATIPSILVEFKKVVNNVLNVFGNGSFDTNMIKEQVYIHLENFGTGLTTKLPNMLLVCGNSIVSGGMFLILGIMIGFYMLYDFDKVNDVIYEFVPKRYLSDAKELMSRVNHSLRGYVTGVLTVMLLVFITQSIGLTLAGLKAPLIFAFFCAITDVIPYFGPYIGAIPAIIVGFTISPITGICVIISIVVVQLLENNFYQPLIMGHTMQLHPVTIMLGLLIFQHFFGILGMVIATPVIACIKVLLLFINEKLGLFDMINGEDNKSSDKTLEKEKLNA